MNEALVTGGNRGLGLEVSRELARKGVHVWLSARRGPDAAAATAALRREKLDVVPLALDVTDEASIDSVVARLEREGIRLNALVNNGAVSLDGFNAAVAEQTIDVNFFGPLRLTDRLRPFFAPSACVVMVSSGLGSLSQFPPALRRRFDPPGSREDVMALMRSFVESVRAGTHQREGWPSAAYSVSKAGLNAMARVLADELRSVPVLVNAASPGWCRTRMGGSSAPRSIEQGADTIVWAATLPPNGPTGGYFADRQPGQW